MSGGRPVVPPIHRSSVFAFDTTRELVEAVRDHRADFSYGRYDNPTVVELERCIAELEGAPRALAFGSGMAAIATTLTALIPPGSRVVAQRELYGGTAELFTHFVPRFAEVVRAAAADPDGLERTIRAGCSVVYLETPVNPTLELVDLERMAAAARAVGALTIVDNTFATPLGQRPLRLGADVACHSATKLLGGHHDVVAGAAALSGDLAEKVWSWRKLLGGVLSPADAYLVHRGLRTLGVRVERCVATAGEIASRLANDHRVLRVGYPGLPGHRGHELAGRQMENAGSVLCFEVNGGEEGAARFLDALRVVRRAASLGGIESLAMIPARVSHAGVPPEERAAIGVTDGLVRLSVGLEPLEELLEDLERGLAATG